MFLLHCDTNKTHSVHKAVFTSHLMETRVKWVIRDVTIRLIGYNSRYWVHDFLTDVFYTMRLKTENVLETNLQNLLLYFLQIIEHPFIFEVELCKVKNVFFVKVKIYFVYNIKKTRLQICVVYFLINLN